MAYALQVKHTKRRYSDFEALYKVSKPQGPKGVTI